MAKLWSKGSNMIYLQVSKWHLVQRIDKHYTGDCIERKLTMWPNEGKMVKELHFPNAEWFITEVAIKIWDYWNQVIITLDNEIAIQFGWNDFNSITNTLLWLDKIEWWASLEKEVNISAYIDKEWYGKFAVWQWGKLAQWFVTKDAMQGCPQATKKTVAWAVKWDFDLVNDWYFNKLSEFIIEKFPDGAKATRDDAVSNVSEKQKLADVWDQNQKDIHKDVDAPVKGYAQPEAAKTQDQASTRPVMTPKVGNKTSVMNDGLSVEDVPF